MEVLIVPCDSLDVSHAVVRLCDINRLRSGVTGTDCAIPVFHCECGAIAEYDPMAASKGMPINVLASFAFKRAIYGDVMVSCLNNKFGKHHIAYYE